MKKETILWLLIGVSTLQGFVNLYLGYSSWMLFIGLLAFFLGLICITPTEVLSEYIIKELKDKNGRRI